MKLRESDHKLLAYLFHNARAPVSEIAKATKLSRDQVNYKINKFISEGIIKKFATLFDSSRLGYNYHVGLFLKFNKTLSSQEMTSKFKGKKNCQSWGKAYGDYDAYVTAIFKDEEELNEHLTNLMGGRNPLTGYLIIKPYFNELYPLKFINEKMGKDLIGISHSVEKVKLDKKDLKILEALEKDGRARVVDIADFAGASVEVVIHRMKRLRREGVIIGTRVLFDMEKLGYFFTSLLVDIPNFTKEKQEKIKQFSRNSKYINSLNFCFHKPNCIITLLHREEKEFREGVDKIKEVLSGESAKIEILPLAHEEEGVNTLPYLAELEKSMIGEVKK